MSGGKITKCQKCGKLVIYGQTCACGHNTNELAATCRAPRKGKNKR